MCQLIETIKIDNNKIYNLDFHNARFNFSRKKIFNISNRINLTDIIFFPDDKLEGLYKCRIIYDKEIKSVEFIPYKLKKIRTLKLIDDNKIEYSYKFKDRKNLENLFNKRETADDIIIVKNNFITDSFFGNIIFQKNNKFYTPNTPLLEGTKRAQLLAEGIILEREILKQDIKKFDAIYLINAMIDLFEVKIKIEDILQ